MSALLDQLLALWREPVDQRPDPEADFRAVYADPVPVNGTPLTAADLVARARALQRAFTDVRLDLVHHLETPTRIVIGFVMRAQHTGPFETPIGTVAPTGRAVAYRVTDILTVTDGRVSDIWVISDDLGLLQQLNALPPAR
jgi:predicted ester cyclase